MLPTNTKAKKLIEQYIEAYQKGVDDPSKPFVGAKPKFLTEPKIATEEETDVATKLACSTISQLIKDAPNGVLLVMGQDSSYCPTSRKLLNNSRDDEQSVKTLPVSVVLNNDWLNTLPRTEPLAVPHPNGRLVIFLGTPGKYLAMCMKSKLQADIHEASEENRFVVVTRGAIMLPLGSQVQNLFGTCAERVLKSIEAIIVEGFGCCSWGHGVGTKSQLLSNAFFHLPSTMHFMHIPQGMNPPKPMLGLEESAAEYLEKEGEETGNVFTEFDSFVDYIKFSNELKKSMPMLWVTNYYDTGLLVSIVQGFVVEAGVGLLTDRDGLMMLRDASIGHTMSKMHQICTVEPYASTRSVYNFYIGDGAGRLNTCMETAFHLMENYSGGAFVTLFVFNNHKWAIEDNLVADQEKEHELYNTEFYDAIATHPNVTMTNTMDELHTKLQSTTKDQGAYVKGEISSKFQIVVVRGLELEVPLLLGDMDPIKESPEMQLMRKILGKFASGCEAKVPVYGCSAFEYIQYLKIFLSDMPEGKLYQYCCGRTDIQAAHMCGYDQPEGRCVLFINDVYGINSLGESLRAVQSGLGDSKQLIIFIWHPSLLGTIDSFHLHRPPMVWPSIGPTLAKYYVRKEYDGVFIDFHGNDVDKVAAQVSTAVESKTPLILINMLPEQEQNYVALDIRAKIPN
jgi:hypothetical protein